MSSIKILWADDEIDMLKPQLFFLQKKGYEVTTVTNGYDAIEEIKSDSDIDIVFLDESMPGLTGLETLEQIKTIRPHLHIVMITKNEAENLMEEAIGARIDDYLIKPVNPNQILLTLKKIIDNKRLVQSKTVQDYQQSFTGISMDINSGPDYKGWVEIYKKLVQWELKMEASATPDMQSILAMQKSEANSEFSRFVERHYLSWVGDSTPENGPDTLSHNLLRNKVFTRINHEVPTVVLLLDNLRYDQWKALEPIFMELFKIKDESFFSSILPTSTQYSRNAIFAGMMPDEIAKHYPEYWRHDFEEGGKNNFEDKLLDIQIKRTFRNPITHKYTKITNLQKAKDLENNIINYLQNDLTVIVYNFIDMLSHARTEMEVIKELAGDEKAYRSLTKSWFLHSPLWRAVKKASEKKIQLFVLTDHGTIRVTKPSKVVGDKNTTTNLRYKMGRNLNFEKKDVFTIDRPEKGGLPAPHLSAKYIFAKEDKFFLYPNNYNHYNNYFRNTFQHGGISMEEMLCPVVELESK